MADWLRFLVARRRKICDNGVESILGAKDVMLEKTGSREERRWEA
jgi:hypothetical protein